MLPKLLPPEKGGSDLGSREAPAQLGKPGAVLKAVALLVSSRLLEYVGTEEVRSSTS